MSELLNQSVKYNNTFIKETISLLLLMFKQDSYIQLQPNFKWCSPGITIPKNGVSSVAASRDTVYILVEEKSGCSILFQLDPQKSKWNRLSSFDGMSCSLVYVESQKQLYRVGGGREEADGGYWKFLASFKDGMFTQTSMKLAGHCKFPTCLSDNDYIVVILTTYDRIDVFDTQEPLKHGIVRLPSRLFNEPQAVCWNGQILMGVGMSSSVDHSGGVKTRLKIYSCSLQSLIQSMEQQNEAVKPKIEEVKLELFCEVGPQSGLASLCVVKEKLITVGGYCDGWTQKGCFYWQPETRKWVLFANLGTDRCGAHTAVLDNTVFVLGGEQYYTEPDDFTTYVKSKNIIHEPIYSVETGQFTD